MFRAAAYSEMFCFTEVSAGTELHGKAGRSLFLNACRMSKAERQGKI